MRISDCSSDVCSSDLSSTRLSLLCISLATTIATLVTQQSCTESAFELSYLGDLQLKCGSQFLRIGFMVHVGTVDFLLKCRGHLALDRKSGVKGKSVSVRIVLGGRG